jgi:hypothetical protein
VSLELILKKQKSLIGYDSESYPSILNLDTYEGEKLWNAFLECQTVKDVRSLYGKNSDIYISILFINYFLGLTSKPFRQGKKYSPEALSLKLLTATLKTVNRKLNSFFYRKGLLKFSQSNREISIGENYSTFLNAFVLPNVVIYQNLIIKNNDLDSELNRLKGYLFKEFPRQLTKPSKPVSIQNLKNHNISQWHYLETVDGITVSIRRIDSQILNLRISFDMPFIFPVGNLNKTSFYNLILRSLNSFNAGY